MGKEILLSHHAKKSLEIIPTDIKKRIFAKLVELKSRGPAIPDVSRLKSFQREGALIYRMRVGDYRIIFGMYKKDILVHAIGKREEIYDMLRTK